MYVQLHMIKHIHRQFVVLHTCTQTLFHTQHSSVIFTCAHNNKRQYFIEPFLIRSVCCLQTEAFLMIVSVHSSHFISFNHNVVIFFCLAVAAALKFQNSDYSRNSEIISHNSDKKNNLVILSLSYIPHIWLFSPQNGQTCYC